MPEPLEPDDALSAFVAEIERLHRLSDEDFAAAYPRHLTPIVTTLATSTSRVDPTV